MRRVIFFVFLLLLALGVPVAAAAETGNSRTLSCYTFSVTLRFGSRGPAVKALQWALREEGFQTTEGIRRPDKPGVFSFATRRAVAAYQKKYHAVIFAETRFANPTGVVGAAMRKKLNERFACTDRLLLKESREMSSRKPSPAASLKAEDRGRVVAPSISPGQRGKTLVPPPRGGPPEKPAVTVLVPTGGEVWRVGERREIKIFVSSLPWIGVNLNHARGGSISAYVQEPRVTPAGTVTVPWSVPLAFPAGEYYVEVYSDATQWRGETFEIKTDRTTSPGAVGTSPTPQSTSTIPVSSAPQPAVLMAKIIYPNGGVAQSFEQGRSYTAEWEFVDNPARTGPPARFVDFFLRKVGLEETIPAGHAPTLPGRNSALFRVPALASEGSYVMELYIDGVRVDGSDSAFSISVPPPALSRLSPEKGPAGFQGTIFGEGFSTYQTALLEFSGPVVSLRITAPALNTTTLRFVVPDVFPGEYELMVSYDGKNWSNRKPFEVFPKPLVYVRAPNGGERWPVGSTQTILWSAAGTSSPDGLKISVVSVSGGEPFDVALSVAQNAGAYPWVISPSFPIDTYALEISCISTVAGYGCSDRSDSLFEIIPAGGL